MRGGGALQFLYIKHFIVSCRDIVQHALRLTFFRSHVPGGQQKQRDHCDMEQVLFDL